MRDRRLRNFCKAGGRSGTHKDTRRSKQVRSNANSRCKKRARVKNMAEQSERWSDRSSARRTVRGRAKAEIERRRCQHETGKKNNDPISAGDLRCVGKVDISNRKRRMHSRLVPAWVEGEGRVRGRRSRGDSRLKREVSTLGTSAGRQKGQNVIQNGSSSNEG